MSFTGPPFGVPPGMTPQQFPPFGVAGGPGMGVQMRMGILPTTTAQRMRQPRPATTSVPKQPMTLLRGPVPPNTPWRKINKPSGGGGSQQPPDPNKPKTTVFVGNISDKAPDALVRGLLTRCGSMLSWKRVQGATGKLQAFGFCEYADPEASLRAIRLLHDLELGDKKLVVKVDAKTRAQLDEYLADKGKSNGTEANGDEIDDFTRNTDVMVKEQLHQLMSDFQHQLSRQFQGSDDKKDKKKPREDRKDGGRRDDNNSVEDLALEDEKKHIISREIDRFRDTYKANEEREKTKEERIAERKERERQRELERERERELREKERDRDRDRDRPRRDRDRDRDRDRERERERDREREREREKKRREREREEEKEREDRERDRERRERDRSRDRDRSRSHDRLDEEEEYEKRKLERKLREKEDAYQERLRNWESRERKRNREYEKYKEKLSMEKLEQDKEGKRLKEFLEDYDDERDDPKYYKGSALERRRKEREKEMDMDSRDRKKELEEFEDIKRKILDEGASDAEEEIEKLELEREKHKRPQLRDRSPSPRIEEIKQPTMKPAFEPAQDHDNPVVIEAPVQQARQRTPDSGSSPEVLEAEDSPEISQESFTARQLTPPQQEEQPDPKPRLSFGGLKLAVGSHTSITPEQAESDDDRPSPLPDSPDSVGAASPTQPSPEPPKQIKHSNTSSTSSKRRKITVGDVFNQDDDTADMGRKKRKLVPIEYSEEEMKAVGQAQLIASAAEEKRKTIKNLIEKIPTAKEELFSYKVDWSIVDEVLMERRIKPWINKKIIEYIGEEEATLTDFICSKLLAHSSAASILNDITMVLDEEAEVFVVKMWRLLIYEVEAKKHGLVK